MRRFSRVFVLVVNVAVVAAGCVLPGREIR